MATEAKCIRLPVPAGHGTEATTGGIMTSPRLTTTQRGLDGAHKRDRKAQLAALKDGQPCPRCGLPMFRGQLLDLDHFPGRAFGGPQVRLLSHRSCNRRAGAILINRMRGLARQMAKARGL
jgi:hypothetical protein